VRGPVNQRVRITVQRPPDYREYQFELRRAEIPLPSVTWHIDSQEARLGVIEVNVIAASTPGEVLKAAQDLQSRGATALVLDLRDNFGGLLTAGVDTARLFLSQGTVIEQQYKGKAVETYRVEKPGPLSDVPLAILINQHTASAAEIIAGALQAQGRARLVGSRSFGKDTIQLVFNLQDESSLHVTSAKWWVPDLAAPLGGSGLQPDVMVDGEPEADKPDAFLQTATELLFAP
jgi:carboxyl-terminal processing protease